MRLGPLETRVLGTLRNLRRAPTRRVKEALGDAGTEVTYATVSAVLDRLHARGVIDRRKKEFKGRFRYVYEYRDIRDQFLRSTVENARSLFGDVKLEEIGQHLVARPSAPMEAEEARAEPPVLTETFPRPKGEPVSRETLYLGSLRTPSPEVRAMSRYSTSTFSKSRVRRTRGQPSDATRNSTNRDAICESRNP